MHRVDDALLFFRRSANAEAIFDGFRRRVIRRDVTRARVVGGLWYHLSEHIVDVLCTALAGLSDPHIRHLVVQTAYEELGENDPNHIHTDLLRETLAVASVSGEDILTWSGHPTIRRLMTDMMEQLRSYQTDAEIAGMLLGMELVAYENIDLVVDYLGHEPAVAEKLAGTRWVRLHHQLEEQHIRRAVGVFVDRVKAPHDQRRFMAAFVDTMDFWRSFWGTIADEASSISATGSR